MESVSENDVVIMYKQNVDRQHNSTSVQLEHTLILAMLHFSLM